MAKSGKKRKRMWAKHPTGVCEVPGCERPHKYGGLCSMHAARKRRRGNTGGAFEMARGSGRYASGFSPTLASGLQELIDKTGEAFAAVPVARGRVRAGTKKYKTELALPRLLAWVRREWIYEVEARRKTRPDGKVVRIYKLTGLGVTYLRRLQETEAAASQTKD